MDSLPDPAPVERVVVMFSGGAGSWAAGRRAAERYGSGRVTLLNCETNTEDEDNYRFLREAAADIGSELVVLDDGRDVWDVFKQERMIGNTRLSTCSRALKQRPARRWLDQHCDPAVTVVVVGIDWTEDHRVAGVERAYAPYRVWVPLTEEPYVDKGAVLAMLEDAGIKPPRLYALGFAHANCGGFCVRAGQGQFKRLLQVFPDRYAHHEQQEEAVRAQLGKDVAILRDRRGGVTRPLTLAALRQRVEAGGEVDPYDIGGCGCFVDEASS